MSIEEHMIEDALFAVARGKTFEEFLEWDRAHGNLEDCPNAFSERELLLIDVMTDYILYKLFNGPQDFREKCDPIYIYNKKIEDEKSRLNYDLHFLPAVSALKDRGISIDTYECNHGWMCVVQREGDKDDKCDFILSPFSYGHEDNLLEWWDGEGEPKGSLTCDEAVEQCLNWLERGHNGQVDTEAD